MQTRLVAVHAPVVDYGASGPLVRLALNAQSPDLGTTADPKFHDGPDWAAQRLDDLAHRLVAHCNPVDADDPIVCEQSGVFWTGAGGLHDAEAVLGRPSKASVHTAGNYRGARRKSEDQSHPSTAAHSGDSCQTSLGGK